MVVICYYWECENYEVSKFDVNNYSYFEISAALQSFETE